MLGSVAFGTRQASTSSSKILAPVCALGENLSGNPTARGRFVDQRGIPPVTGPRLDGSYCGLCREDLGLIYKMCTNN